MKGQAMKSKNYLVALAALVVAADATK